MDDASPPEDTRRPSIEKAPMVIKGEAPFERLPDEIIEQVLRVTDPNGFASLIVLNRKWRDVSQRAHLFRHHLAQCPSYSANPSGLPSAEQSKLPRLRRLFAREVKRNLFEPYIRPSETLVKLISNSISSSSCPGGEGLSFSASLRGHYLLAYNSSRIYVIDVRSSSLEVRRELKILRRPASVCITDDAKLLAVLSTEMQIDLYDLKESPPKRKQSIILDNNPRTIALSSCGSVLAAAYESGIEVSALGTGTGTGALPTEKRAVKCDAVDALTFSFDGTQILGTTLQSSTPSTVVITAPYFDPAALMCDENLSTMWTTSILFPNSSRDCSHAALLQDGHEEAAWAFAYDRSFETFRAVRIDDLRNGTTYFTGPVPKSQAQLLPTTLPSTTYNGELVSAAFHGNEIWLYGVPENPAYVSEKEPLNESTLSTGITRRNSAQNSSRPSSTRTHDAAAAAAASAIGRAPQWQMICDRARNHIIAGQKVSQLSGVTHVKWVSERDNDSLKERLVVTARGITAPRLITEEEDLDYVDGGRVLLLDFDYGINNGTKKELTIEVGTDEAEILEEEKRDLETEVAIVRRRTVAQRRGGGNHSLLRVATTAQALTAAQTLPNDHDDDDPLTPRILGRNPASGLPSDEAEEVIEAQEALDAPYAHSSPRSGVTLRRAATAAAANRQFHPRTADGRPIEYRRADGRREHPHESDADNWVPPPPPYQAEDPNDAPAFLRAPAILAAIASSAPRDNTSPPEASKSEHSAALAALNPTMTRAHLLAPPSVSQPSMPLLLTRSASDSELRDSMYADDNMTVSDATTDLYDATPPESPRAARQRSEFLPTSDVERPLPVISLTSQTPPPGLTSDGYQNAFSRRPSLPISGLDTLMDRSEMECRPASALPLGVGPIFDSLPTSIQLLNTQTWPSVDPSEPDVSSSRTLASPDSALANPAHSPSRSPDQDARPYRRLSQGHSRRLSGSIRAHQRSIRQQNQMRALGMHHPSLSVPIIGASARVAQPGEPHSAIQQRSITPQHEIEQPLIISTPAGVSGAYDPPGRRISRRGDTPILAPVPKRPLPKTTGDSAPRSAAVDRLETIFTPRPAESMPAAAASKKPNNRLFPGWIGRKPSASPGRTASVVNRRPSRAGRSAAKNMQDARKRGWKRKDSQKRKKGQANKGVPESGSMGDWLDVPPSPTSREHEKEKQKEKQKEKKCIVM